MERMVTARKGLRRFDLPIVRDRQAEEHGERKDEGSESIGYVS